MDFDLTEDQQLLSQTLERLLADHYDFEHRKSYLASAHGWSREQWRRYADMGLLGLPFAEADGGLGGGAIETMLVMEAFGRSLVLEPFLATVLLGGGLLQDCASAGAASRTHPADHRRRALARLCACRKPSSRYDLYDVDTRARRERQRLDHRGAQAPRAARGLRRSAARQRTPRRRAARPQRHRTVPGRRRRAGTQRRGYVIRIACVRRMSNFTASESLPTPRSTMRAPRCQPSNVSSIARSPRSAQRRWAR